MEAPAPRLAGKRVFITGTGSGMGRATALMFARHGAVVMGCDLNVEGERETARMVKEVDGTMHSLAPIDLTDEVDVRKWFARGLDLLGGIDVLFNNASAPKFAPLESMTWDDWSFTIRNELDLIFWACKVAWEPMRDGGGGSIINTASISGHIGARRSGCFAHSAAKAGVMGLTRQLAAEGAPHKIRVNTISPGTVDTPANDVFRAQPDVWQTMIDMHPLGRLGTPEDIAYCALYLASDESSWVTGADIAVDGGVTAT